MPQHRSVLPRWRDHCGLCHERFRLMVVRNLIAKAGAKRNVFQDEVTGARYHRFCIGEE